VDVFLRDLNENLTVYVVIPLILIIGLYLTFRMKWIQFTRIGVGLKHLLMKEEKEKGSISNFQAISTVLAGNLGTGNISGMAIALSVGGPGSLFWMWIMVFLSGILKYAGCFLGFKYRIKNKENEYVGGPMYYLTNGLKSKTLGILFAVFCIFTAITTGNLVQVNSIILPLKEIGINPFLVGIVLAILVGIVILGGTMRFARVAEVVVPVMALLYIISAAIILVIYYDKIIPALSLVIFSAFKPLALAGGGLGYGFFYALSSGFQRGVFATDAGVGVAPILQSGAREKKPVLEGFVAMTAPLFVIIICTMTVLVLMVTDAWVKSGLESTNMCAWAFEKGLSSKIGVYIIIVALLFFAFTTILAWSTAAGKAVEYLFGLKSEKIFEYIFVLIVPVGALLNVKLIWSLADVSMALMLIINLIAVIGLSKKIIKDTLAFKMK
jgi:AGCS family alanine or glycine:cation symporter